MLYLYHNENKRENNMTQESVLVKDFEDISLFQGIVQFTANGIEFRFENSGAGMWKVFVKRNDAFIFDSIIKSKSSKTNALYNAYLSVESKD